MNNVCVMLWMILAAVAIPVLGAVPAGWVSQDNETLYNGLRLPAEWPPMDGVEQNGKPPPYLRSLPAVIPIDLGRQLFVDDFLIERTSLKRTFHRAEKYSGNPILKPETPAEKEGGAFIGKLASGASPFDDGLFFDPADGLFKMWYSAGNCHDTALCYSKDGIHWERPNFDVVPGSNIVIPYDPDFTRDGFSPWIDYATKNPAERYKAFLYARSKTRKDAGYLYTSPDGIHWSEKKQVADRSIGDNTLLFYNPFRGKWCLSIRRNNRRNDDRIRHYFEAGEFLGLANFARGDDVFWAAADEKDTPDPSGWRRTGPSCTRLRLPPTRA